jgi:hypothetical protein
MGIMKTVVVVMVMIIGLAVSMSAPAWSQKPDDDEGPMSNMHFVILRDYNGKPIKNAAVVLHPVNAKGKQSKGGLELKTDDAGKTGIDGIPYGPLRVQVLAPGFQTFGEDYEVNKPETEITVKLKRPGAQYSIYGVQEKDKKTDPPKPPDQKPQ